MRPAIQIPPAHDSMWVNRLRTNNRVWLAKEQRVAIIDMPWEPPEPGHVAGFLRMELYPGHIERWFVRGNGTGLDHSQLVLPLEGHLDDDPPPVDEPVIMQLRRELVSLLARVRALEKTVASYARR